jgi:thymidylate kinase
MEHKMWPFEIFAKRYAAKLAESEERIRKEREEALQRVKRIFDELAQKNRPNNDTGEPET